MWVVGVALSWATLLAATLLGLSLLSQSGGESLDLGHDTSEDLERCASVLPDTCRAILERDTLARTASAEMASFAQC
jgi:hypothetical protein